VGLYDAARTNAAKAKQQENATLEATSGPVKRASKFSAIPLGIPSQQGAPFERNNEKPSLIRIIFHETNRAARILSLCIATVRPRTRVNRFVARCQQSAVPSVHDSPLSIVAMRGECSNWNGPNSMSHLQVAFEGKPGCLLLGRTYFVLTQYLLLLICIVRSGGWTLLTPCRRSKSAFAFLERRDFVAKRDGAKVHRNTQEFNLVEYIWRVIQRLWIYQGFSFAEWGLGRALGILDTSVALL
jgi:hypothetical protein